MELDWSDILVRVFTFATGAGALGLMQFMLSFRKQRKDEFVILRETWKGQFESMTKQLDETKQDLQKAHEKIHELEEMLEAAIGQKLIYQEKLKEFLDGSED